MTSTDLPVCALSWETQIFLAGDFSGLRGVCTGLIGDCTGVDGDCTNYAGDLDECEITEEDREYRIRISDLVE